MIEFIYGFLVACIFLMGIAIIDVKLFKDKLINKKVNDYRVYLFYTCVETSLFIFGYLVGSLK